MKYLKIFTIILLIASCGFLVDINIDRNRERYEQFWSEFNNMAEMLNDRIDRILYVKVLQEGDTLWFISDDLVDTSWIVNDSSLIYDDGANFDNFEDLYLMGDVVIYPDQFSGNTYVINADGDTIFKYIKREKE